MKLVKYYLCHKIKGKSVKKGYKMKLNKRKRIIAESVIMSCICIILSSATKIKWGNGVWDGEGKGFQGPIHVSVTVKKHTITNIKIIDSKDDQPYFGKAIKIIPEIIKKQSTEIDGITGATFSSKGIKKAVADALKKAEK